MFDQAEHKRYMRKIIVIATFGGLLFGYDVGVLNGALPYMAKSLGLNSLSTGLITSALLMGAVFGAILGGKLSDLVGRRKNILFIALLFFISTLGCSLAPDIQTMMICRFVLGFAVGSASVTVPTYLAEMAPAQSRGRMVTWNELMIVGGVFIAFISNAVLGITLGENEHVWRFMLALAMIPAVCLFFGMLTVPESPRWLVKQGREAEAKAVLERIRDEHTAGIELYSIKRAISQEQHLGKVKISELNIPWIRRILLIGIAVAVFSQTTGVNSIMYFGTEILRDAGFETSAALIGNTAFGLISVLSTFAGIWLLDRAGRRPMMLVGLAGTTTILLIIAIATSMLAGHTALPYVVLSLTVIFLAFMQGAIGPVLWVTLSEIFPLRIRGAGMGISVAFLWITNFFIGLTFPMMLEGFGLSGTFFAFAAIGVVGFVIMKMFFPETKGKTLEEIEEAFKQEHGIDSVNSQHDIMQDAQK